MFQVVMDALDGPDMMEAAMITIVGQGKLDG